MKITLIVPNTKSGRGNQLDLKYISKLFNKSAKNGGSSLMGCIPSAVPTIAALTPPDISIRIIDENIEEIDFDHAVDLVGISFLTFSSVRAYEIADEFKKRGVYVVFGGIHTSLFPDEALKKADTIFIGEAEETWPQFIEDFRNNKQKKIYEAKEKPDLKKLVIPRWDLLKNSYYNVYHVQTTRGCPFDCDFCGVRTYQGGPRHKPIENVIKEIKATKKYNKTPGLHNVVFADDNIISNKKYAKELFRALVPLNVKWTSQISINLAQDDELLELAKESGCQGVLIGFESISQNTLDSINKGKLNKIEFYREAIKKIHSKGIIVYSMFVLGFDGEDTSMFRELYDFVKETNIAFPVFNILTPIPGTRLYERMEKAGRIINKEWDKYNGSNVCFQPDSMTVDDLQKGYFWLLKNIYSLENCSERIDNLYDEGVIKLDKNYSIIKFFMKLKFFFQKTKEKRDVAEFLMMSIKQLKKKMINMSAVAFMLDFFYFANSLPDTDFEPGKRGKGDALHPKI